MNFRLKKLNIKLKTLIHFSIFVLVLFLLPIGFKNTTKKPPKNLPVAYMSQNLEIKEDHILKPIKKKPPLEHNDNLINNKDNKNPNNNYNNNEVKQTNANGDFTPISPNKEIKIAYLTFDDGPSPDITPQILDTLDRYNIKATFFVIGSFAEKYPEIIKRTKNIGHIIANHTYSHNIDYIYSDPKNLVNDFHKGDTTLKSIIPDYNGKLVRFPGGSNGRNKIFKDAVKQAGYHYVDWNCLNKDAEGNIVPVDTLMRNIYETSHGKKDLTVLMHDSSGKETTVSSLPAVIEYLKSEGYTFNTLK